MAADGEPQEDRGGSEISESSASTSSPSPGPPSLPPPLPLPPAPNPPPPTSSSSAPTGAPPLPLPSHLYHPQRLLSLHLSPAQPRPPHAANSEPSPTTAPDRPFREDCWSENATLTLIQAWGDRYLELNRGNLKQKHWKDVADCVNSRPLTSSKPPKTDVQCKNRLDTLKKKYKIEKSKLVTGGAPSKWAFFHRIEELIGSSKKPKTPASGKASRSVVAVADANCTSNPDGQCMAAMPAAKCTMEEDVKPPLFFFPPQATVAVPPPPMNHHVGGVVVHMNHHLGNVLHLNHHVAAPIIHHLAGEGTHINHQAGMPINNHLVSSAACAAAVNHQMGDGGGGGGGAAAAAGAGDTASKSRAYLDMSQSSPPHKRPDKRRLKRKGDLHSPSEDGPFRELARAICKFADVYERVEMAKLEQLTVLEKQRRELAKDLEIQRMQLFTQMQIEQAKMKYGSSKHENADNHS